jgi:hypothetical protein
MAAVALPSRGNHQGISREYRLSRNRETIQFASNAFGFRNGIRQGDGTVQRIASFIEPLQFFEQRTAQPVPLEVGIQLAVALVEAFWSQVVAGVREGIGVRQWFDGAVTALRVQSRIAPDHDEPCRGVSGRAFSR